MAPLRLVFMGTPDFAVPPLAALMAAGHDVACVYTQPPRRSGRGHKETPSPVHLFAGAKAIEIRHPTSLKDPPAQRDFADLGADVAVVAAYGLILPPAILAAPRLGCVNIHASLLPRWRGAAPIQRAIEAGDAETGITIMQMDEGLDTGNILTAEAVPIESATTGETLHDALAALGARMIVPALDGLAAGTLAAVPQPADGATYARKLDRAEAQLDWTADAAALERRIRAFDPWPGAWFAHGDERVRVISAEVIHGTKAAGPGTVLDDNLTVACGEGALRPVRVQRPGRAPMETAALLRGHPIPKGAVLVSPDGAGP